MTALSEELALPAYDGLTDSQCLTALTIEDIPTKQVVTTRDIEMYLESQDKLYTIRTHVADAAKHVTMVLDRFESFNMLDANDEAVVTSMLSAIVTASVITQPEMDAILAKGDKLISRAEELGITNYHLGYIAKARI